MSKLENKYNELKNKDKETLYLFKNGIFYIFLKEDAEFISKKFNLKITYLNDTLKKCGFPSNSLQKYLKLFDEKNLKYKIVDNSLKAENKEEYLRNIDCINIFNEIKKLDLDKTTPMQAHQKILEWKTLLNK